MATLRASRGSRGSRILSVGAYRPSRVVSNQEVCARIDSSDDWIRRRSGIVTRRFAGPDETVVCMGAEAAVKALAQAGVDPGEVGMVLLASMSHLEQTPAAAPRIASLMGALSAAAADVSAACAGFCYALGLADALIRAGSHGYVVVIGSEKMSDIIDPEDRGTAFLFGDGAGAVVVGPCEEPGIGPVVWGSDGSRHHLIAHESSWLETCEPQRPWPALRMVGPEVYRWAVRIVPQIGLQALEAAGITVDELSAFIPHQANARIVDAASQSLRLAPHTIVARDVVCTGNTSAASIPLAMDSLGVQGALPSGGHALLVGFGAGLTHAAQVVSLP